MISDLYPEIGINTLRIYMFKMGYVYLGSSRSLTLLIPLL